MLRLFRYICTVFILIAYDKHDNRTIPPYGNHHTLMPMFCLSKSDTLYLYPYPTDMRKSIYSLSGIVTNEMYSFRTALNRRAYSEFSQNPPRILQNS